MFHEIKKVQSVQSRELRKAEGKEQWPPQSCWPWRKVSQQRRRTQRWQGLTTSETKGAEEQIETPVQRPAQPRKASCTPAGLGEHELRGLSSTAVFEMFFLLLTFSVYLTVVFRVSKGFHKGHPDTAGPGPTSLDKQGVCRTSDHRQNFTCPYSNWSLQFYSNLKSLSSYVPKLRVFYSCSWPCHRFIGS